MSGLQVTVLLFVLVQGYFTHLHFKRREFTLKECVGWLLIWVVFGAVALFPGFFHVVSDRFGAIRSLDFFTILGFVLVLSISFYTYIQVDKQRKRLERIIRELSLQEVDEAADSRKKE